MFVFLIVIGIIGVFILFLSIQLSTNNLIQQIKYAFLSMDYYVEEKVYSANPQYYSNPNTNYIIYNNAKLSSVDINQRFNRSRFYQGNEPDNVIIVLKLNRLFALHNFYDGYVWFYYDIKYLSKNGEAISGGIVPWDNPVRIKIHKEAGTWLVTEVNEVP